ncbi:nucleoside recognition domain-containing protein [Bacillus sp. 2205SS5-2]|uniref:nucleoside recognition domain-containing protein n=1 Tax=Bacillus sp. 2205SS5-2 TaxID=3109031 RepID=UPI003004F155
MMGSLVKGTKVGLTTTWTLGKIIFPTTLLVTLVQYTPLLPWLIEWISPFMSWFGLSGDAAIPLVLGNFLNLYAAIGGILSLDLTVKEVFIVAMMLSFSHNLLIESSVAVKVGVRLWIILLVRIGLALFSAVVLHLVWDGGSELAQYGFMPSVQADVGSWAMIAAMALQKATFGVLQLALIVIPLMIGIQFLKDLQWLQKFSALLAPFTRRLGMNENTSTTLAAGLLFGLAYGAGVMIQAVKEDGVSKRDVTLAFIFLVGCHAVVEDTLIFLPLGIPVWPLLLIRLGTAIILTWAIGRAWKKKEVSNGKEFTLT